ncbi:hypothetical protein BJ322DRAFT_1034153 [Thelephora terrestris]|uniref:Uncharacterized protein n=1 Tax=Thelephora terrestris TaxID=56493 RepID=A0A9P6HS85_9AGAM|nr:hypothetical protein BJ322DRAFT_1034153 [Thelephora terrestris]
MPTPVQYAARSENPSEVAALHGQKAKTPIIAGSVSGACVLLAWTIGFIIFFVRRRRQKKLAKERGFKSHRDIIDFVPIPNATTFIIPPDPALVCPRRSYERHTHDSERQGQPDNSPSSEVLLRAPGRSEQGTIRSPEAATRTNSTTYSTPMITTVGPSTGELGTVESSYPMLDPPSRLPDSPLARKTQDIRES